MCILVFICIHTDSAELVAIVTVPVVIVGGALIAVVIVVILIIVVTIFSQRSKGSPALVTTVTNEDHELPLVKTDIDKSDISTKTMI